MERFATAMDEFAGEERELIELGPCDGSCKQSTLEEQLIAHGILERRWSHHGEDAPGSVFYWFKHVVSPIYTISSISEDTTWHCGICYKDITRKFYYERTGSKVVNLNERYDISMPDSIVSGSECINLTKDMKNLLGNLRENHMYKNRLRFARGRILARDIVTAHDEWDEDSIALPLRWFYFEDWWRPILMLGQDNMGYGYHVRWRGGERSVWGNMRKANKKSRNVRAFELFGGEDEFHSPVDIFTHGRQTAADDRYVVFTRQSARDIHDEINRRMRELKNRGRFKDDK